ncbi:potassium channel subfamily K member 10-like isoform X2 [Vespa crabro]|uniref:potassium channel subfamily K member 10-like isoform X2 n=1 Tax=Vespa crabro TaxID=7445 RepID=UPI001EFF7794|nr:potassium channel subfamily K member 10-like isoform X2 [Vespa crabro]
MDVPLFPAPPVFGGAATSINDVCEVASSDVVTHRKGERHAAAVTGNAASSLEFGKTPVVRGKGHRRNLVHPKRTTITKKEASRRHVITEFRVRMTEPRGKNEDEEDDDDDDDDNEDDDDDDVITCADGLVWLLSIWTIAGAAAFCATEGPREREQVVELKDMQKDLAVGLATELRQLRTKKEEDMEPVWSNKVRQYVAKHEQLLLAAVNSGYGEANDGGQLWTFPGCVLFAVSLITTLGFGAPVPRTNAGRTVAIVFAAIGIPAHFLLIINVGILLAVRLQKYAIRKTSNKKDLQQDPADICCSPATVPKWVKLVPFVCIGGYYILGILCFGIARSRPLATSVLFPLDFTAAGGLSTTHGYVRVFYAIYLEGAVIIAAVAVAVLRVSATQSLTNIGVRYGLLTEA